MAGRSPVLIMIQGDDPGSRWKLQETRVTTLGRSSRNQISLVSQTVSRYHCEISCINGLWHIADLNSKKGTFLNGTQITQREVLKPGDLVRLSTNVFRFDLVDETVKDDEAMTAIRDASLNADIGEKGESKPTLEGIRLRSQLSAAEEEEQRKDRKKVMANVKFVGVIAFVVTVVVGGALAFAHNSVGQLKEDKARLEGEARQAYEEAIKLKDLGPSKHLDALEAFKDIITRYPGTEAAADAQETYRELEPKVVEYELARIMNWEGEGRYMYALARTSRLLKHASDPAITKFLKARRDSTERLSRGAFREKREAATDAMENGDYKKATEIYEDARAMVGIPALAELAGDMILEIETRQAKGTTTPAATEPTKPAAREPEEDDEYEVDDIIDPEWRPPVRDSEASGMKPREDDDGEEFPPYDDFEDRLKPPVDIRP